MPDAEKIREALAKLSPDERERLERRMLGWYADTRTPLVTVHVDRDGTRHAHEADVVRDPRGGFLLVGFAVGDMEPTVAFDDDVPGYRDEDAPDGEAE